MSWHTVGLAWWTLCAVVGAFNIIGFIVKYARDLTRLFALVKRMKSWRKT